MFTPALKNLEIEYTNLEALTQVSQRLIDASGDVKLWIFEGEMGAGKTTLIKSICRNLGVVDNVTSPTFSLVNEYRSATGKAFYHFDFYRIKNEVEAMDIGCEDYFYSGDFCFIEWPSKIPNLLPDKFLKIEISIIDNQTRLIQLSSNEN